VAVHRASPRVRGGVSPSVSVRSTDGEG
jgi:hypothetical protein